MLIKFLVIISFLFGLFNSNNKLLLVILGLSLLNTVITSILIFYGKPIFWNNKIYIIIHSILWLIILLNHISKKRIVLVSIFLYFLVSLMDLFYLENYFHHKYVLVFVSGALLYLILFLVESFQQLIQENLDFFFDKSFILIFSPILFFIGYSLLFGFESKKLNDTTIIPGCSLFCIISNFVNIIYYLLIILYIKKNFAKSHVKS